MKKQIIIVVLLLISIMLLCACGNKEVEVVETPTPTVEPTPTPISAIASESKITLNGKEISGYNINNTLSVKTLEAINALGIEEISKSKEGIAFTWRLDTVSLPNEEYIDIETLYKTLDIGYLYDDEYDHHYLTPAAGNWTLPEGYNVPVFMYHDVRSGNPEADQFVSPESMEEQLAYIVENGYTPIWFEDLWNVENIEKPIILTFDDGWIDLYDNLLPLIKKYNVKVTFCIITSSFTTHTHWNQLSIEQLHEFVDTGLVKIESHTVDHDYLYELTDEEQDYQFIQSRLDITREFGEQPIMMCYPSGTNNGHSLDLTREYYRFGVIMQGMESYNTSDDPTLIYRFFPKMSTTIEEYANMLRYSFPDD